jgi:hypothetical protein
MKEFSRKIYFCECKYTLKYPVLQMCGAEKVFTHKLFPPLRRVHRPEYRVFGIPAPHPLQRKEIILFFCCTVMIFKKYIFGD